MTTSNGSGITAAGSTTTTTDPDVVGVTDESLGTRTGASPGLGDKGRQVTGDVEEQAQQVAETAKDEAAAVGGSAQEQAQNVLAEAKDQAGDLFEDLRRQVSEQSDVVRDRLSEFLTGVGSELDDMATAGGGAGYATQVVRQVGDRTASWGSQLRDQGSGDLLAQTRSFARRKPGTFLLGALAVGVLAGRLTRGAKAHHDQETDSTNAVESGGSPVVPVATDPLPTTGSLNGMDSYGTRPAAPAEGTWTPVVDPAGDERDHRA